MLPDAILDAWLDPELTDPEAARELIASVPQPVLSQYPVSKAVNNVRNNGPDLLVLVHSGDSYGVAVIVATCKPQQVCALRALRQWRSWD